MSRLTKAIVLSCIAVVVFDALAATAALLFDFEYARIAPGSYALYATAGFFAARHGEWWNGFVVGWAMGLTDATAGWAVSWVIGPGRVADLTVMLWIVTAIMVAVIGAVLAGIGGAVARALGGARAPAA